MAEVACQARLCGVECFQEAPRAGNKRILRKNAVKISTWSSASHDLKQSLPTSSQRKDNLWQWGHRRACKLAPLAATASGVKEGVAAAEMYEVELEKPFGLRFTKGADGGTYIDAVAPNSPAESLGVAVYDKVIETSAMFGSEYWPATDYGRTMYTIKNRIGTLAVRLQRRNGVSPGLAQDRAALSNMRKGNLLGDDLRMLQSQNALKKSEAKEVRAGLVTEGLRLYKAKDYAGALAQFGDVLLARPERSEAAVASYNMACCHAQLGNVDAGLAALEAALSSGFDDYQAVRKDADLEGLRGSPRFQKLVDSYDEPFINENAINALKGVFGFFGKK